VADNTASIAFGFTLNQSSVELVKSVLAGIGSAIEAINRQRALANLQKAIDTISVAVPEKELGRLGEAAAKVGEKVKEFFKDKLKDAFVTAPMERTKKIFESIASLESPKFIGEMVNKTAEVAEQAIKTARTLNTTSEAVQELQFVAKVTGTSFDDIKGGLTHFQKAVSEGGAKTVEAMKRLGISMTDPAIKSGDASKAFDILTDRFAQLPAGAAKSQLAATLLGDNFAQLIPVLDRGALTLDDLREKANKTGFVIKDGTATSLEELKHRTAELEASFTGLRNRAVAALVPALEKVIAKISEWIDTHQEQMLDLVAAAADGLSVGLDALGVVFDTISTAIGFFMEHADLARAVIIALGVVIAAFAAAAAIEWLIAFWPIALIVAIIAGIILFIQHFGDIMKVVLSGIWEALQILFLPTKLMILGAIEVVKLLVAAFQGLWQGITDGAHFAAGLIGGLVDRFWAVVDGIKGAAIGLFSAISDTVAGVVHAITAVFDWVIEKAKETWDTIRNAPVIKQVIDIGEDLFSGPSMFDHMNQVLQTQVPGGGAAAVTTTTNAPSVHAQVTIHAANADAQAVATIVNQQMQAMMRDAHAATGGADIR
jgi:hypothetical protein